MEARYPEQLVGVRNSEASFNDRWWPSVKIRPHHLTNPEVQGALIGKDIIALNFDGPRLLAEYPEEVVLYQADAYGDIDHGKETVKPIKATLAALSDDDVIQLDINKDDICNSCLIGTHCVATNYMLFGVNKNTFEREKTEMDKVHKTLIEAGFAESTDFIFEETQLKLFDYHGRSIWDQGELTPQSVTFLSMLVRVEALRKIFAR